MVINLKRQEAINIIQYYYLIKTSLEDRGNILLANGIEDIGDEEEGWQEAEIMKHQYNSYVLEQYSYGSLIRDEYLELFINDIYRTTVSIIDKTNLDVGIKCVCCGYKTFYEREGYSICPLCSWEDDFSKEDEYSAVNHSTLQDYRVNFFKEMEQDRNNIKYQMFNR